MKIEEFTEMEEAKPPPPPKTESKIIDLRPYQHQRSRVPGFQSGRHSPENCVNCEQWTAMICEGCKEKVCLTCKGWHQRYACGDSAVCWGD